MGRVGVHDNFFELGGDSILSIQVVARARARGVGITPKLVFDHPTVADLASVAGVESVQAEQGIVTGEAPLIPIQSWFYGLDLPERNHFNQSVLLDVSGVDRQTLDAAVRALLTHHDALRLRSDGTRLWFAEPDGQGLEDADGRTADDVQASLDLVNGPVTRFVLISEDRLLIAVHHMAVDGVSWRILLEDLAAARSGAPLAPKTTSFKEWAKRLRQASDPSEDEYWDSVPVTELPVDHPAGDNTVVSTESVAVELDEAETRALLTQVPAVYRTQINDVLLTALAQTLATWTRQESVSVALEGHGREELFDDVDVSRTVGWFTSLFPVALTPGADRPGEALKAVKEQLRAVPRRGVGYGLTHDLTALPTGLSFNYLGQFDTEGFATVNEPSGAAEAATGRRAHLIEVNAAVSDGRLSVAWTYSAHLHDRATVEGLAEDFVVRLRELIEHCLTEEAGGLTPSDVSLAGLDQVALDRLVGGDRQVEDVYPLSPLQQGMLFHALAEPDSGMYVEQIHWRLEGDLDIDRMRAAWQRAMDRHAILRTGFLWEGTPRPLQVVRRRQDVPFEFHDVSGLPESEQEIWLRDLLDADRVRGFDLSAPPLMRIHLVRNSLDAHVLVWSFHHILLDGWSTSTVLADVFADNVESVGRRPYREFIGWLDEQDADAAETYWRGALAGFTESTPLGIDRPIAGPEGEPGTHGVVMSKETS
ncbi:non-ribosomal peptide synthetase, partial [Streptomyces sp. CS014]